jgi:hypothetical protein
VNIPGLLNEMKVSWDLPSDTAKARRRAGLDQWYTLEAKADSDKDWKDWREVVSTKLPSEQANPTYLKPHPDRRPPKNTCRLRLSYVDDVGTQFQVEWPSVTFEETPWRDKLLATVAVTALSGAVIVLLPRVFRSPPLLASLVRYPVWGIAVLASLYPDFTSWINNATHQVIYLPGVTLGLIVLLTVLLGVGLVSPKALRAFAGDDAVANMIALFAIQFPRFRAHLFRDYVAELEERLKAELADAKEEYVALPARLDPDDQPGPRARPDEAVRDLLTGRPPKDGKSRVVLVQWPGGCGKSAFVRQVLALALKRFLDNPTAPVPVICKPSKDKTVHDLVREGLGRHSLSDSVFDEHLAAGHLVAVFDGLSESEMTPEQLADFVKGDSGQKTALLLATRPGRPYREELRKVASDRTILVDPQSLNDDSLTVFMTVYLARDRADPKTRDTAAALSEKTLATCRARDGKTYLPLLVRLSILVGPGADSVAQINRKTFDTLVRERYPDLVDRTVQMCVKTYGEQGNQARVLATEANEERRALLQQMYNVGILVSAELRGRASAAGPHGDRPNSGDEDRSLPVQVRFFHDSMQSYLTAVGFFHGEDVWSQLPRAACNPIFGRPSELFQMCLHVFKPDDCLRLDLEKGLRDWANRFERGLSKEIVLRACPDDLRQALGWQLSPEESAGIAVKKAVDLCGQQAGDVGEEIRLLGILYGNLGPTIWDLEHAEGAATAATRQVPPAPPSGPQAVVAGS